MFFVFDQNNSGGEFITDEKVCHLVIIEADNAATANGKAMMIGIYFDGVATGHDCECCGDRWYPIFDDSEGLKFPMTGMPSFLEERINADLNTVEEYAQWSADNYGWTDPDCRIYYANGEVKEFHYKARDGEVQ